MENPPKQKLTGTIKVYNFWLYSIPVYHVIMGKNGRKGVYK